MVLVVRETEYGYYKSTKSHPVMFEIIGRGTVKVMTRLLYDKTMKGKQHRSASKSSSAGRASMPLVKNGVLRQNVTDILDLNRAAVCMIFI